MTWRPADSGLFLPIGGDEQPAQPRSALGPTPDSRWIQFIGGLDANGQALPMTYESLAAVVDELVTTATTPSGVKGLLATSRRLWGLAWFHYELLFVSSAWALIAVEAALRARMNAAESVHFVTLIKKAGVEGILSAARAEQLDAGRRLRNMFAHQREQGTWLPGMAMSSLRASHDIVADLFPDDRNRAA